MSGCSHLELEAVGRLALQSDLYVRGRYAALGASMGMESSRGRLLGRGKSLCDRVRGPRYASHRRVQCG